MTGPNANATVAQVTAESPTSLLEQRTIISRHWWSHSLDGMLFLLLLLTVGLLGYGSTVGELTVPEANWLLASDARHFSCWTPTAWLAGIRQVQPLQYWGVTEIAWCRLTNSFALACIGLLLFAILCPQSGKRAATIGVIAFLLAPALLYTSLSLGPEPWFCLWWLLLIFGRNIAKSFAVGLPISIIAAGLGSVWCLELPTEVTAAARSDRLLAVVTALGWSLPLGLIAWINAKPSSGKAWRDWNQLQIEVVLVASLLWGFFVPGCWAVSSLACTFVAARQLGAAFSPIQNHETAAPSSYRWPSAALTVLLGLGLPALVLVLTTLRIFTYFQRMERTQIVFVIGFGCLLYFVAVWHCLGGRLLAERGWQWRLTGLLPTLVLLGACRIYWVEVVLADNRQNDWCGRYARAITRELPPESQLVTTLPVNAVCRYYLTRAGRQVVSVSDSLAARSALQTGPTNAGDWLLVAAIAREDRLEPAAMPYAVPDALAGSWQLCRRWDGPTGHGWELWQRLPQLADQSR